MNKPFTLNLTTKYYRPSNIYDFVGWIITPKRRSRLRLQSCVKRSHHVVSSKATSQPHWSITSLCLLTVSAVDPTWQLKFQYYVLWIFGSSGNSGVHCIDRWKQDASWKKLGGSKSVKSPPDVILSPKCIKSVEFLSGVQLILIRRICRHTAVVTFVNKSTGHLNA